MDNALPGLTIPLSSRRNLAGWAYDALTGLDEQNHVERWDGGAFAECFRP